MGLLLSSCALIGFDISFLTAGCVALPLCWQPSWSLDVRSLLAPTKKKMGDGRMQEQQGLLKQWELNMWRKTLMYPLHLTTFQSYSIFAKLSEDLSVIRTDRLIDSVYMKYFLSDQKVSCVFFYWNFVDNYLIYVQSLLKCNEQFTMNS